MKLKKIILCVILSIITILALFSNNVLAVDTSMIEVSSPSAILIDAKTGRILYEKNAYQKMYPASTTKILTGIIVLENAKDLQEKVTISYNSVFSIPNGYSSDLLKVGEELSIEEMLYALLVKSSNEAAVALAEHIAGGVDSFSSMMNTKASEIGCKNTHFINPNGVHDDNHYTTAYDLSLIAKYAMKNDTFRKVVSTVSHTLPSTEKYSRTDRNLITTNDFIKKSNKNYYEYAIGIKTGYTSKSKYCLVAGANKEGVELISVVLGADKSDSNGYNIRDKDAKGLFEFIYNNFSEKSLAKVDSSIKSIKVSNATKDTNQLDLMPENELTVLITNDRLQENIVPEITLNEKIKAPIAKGDVLGTVKYTVDNVEYETKLLAANDVVKSNLFTIIVVLLAIGFVLYIIYKYMQPKKKKGKKKSKKYVGTYR